MADFRIETRPVASLPEGLEIVIDGRIASVQEVQKFQKAVLDAMKGRVCLLIMDLEKMPTIASSGLSFLADLIGRLEIRGGAIFLVKVSAAVKIVLNSLGLLQFLHFEDDLESARASASAAATSLRTLPRLRVLGGLLEGATFPVTAAPLAVGSDASCPVTANVPGLERRHAEVTLVGADAKVKDLSKSGVWVAKERAGGRTLAPGDVLRCGTLELRFLGPGEE